MKAIEEIDTNTKKDNIIDGIMKSNGDFYIMHSLIYFVIFKDINNY